MHRSEPSRRQFLRQAAATAGLAIAGPAALAVEPRPKPFPGIYKLSVAGYSYRKHLTAKKDGMTLDGYLELAAKLKLDAVEPTSYYFRDTSEKYLKHIRDKAKDLGLAISGTAVGNNFALPPGPARDKQLAHVKTWVDHAAVLGAPVIRIFGTGRLGKGQTADEAYKLVLAAIEECCTYAGKHGVALALENHGGALTTTGKELLRFVGDVKSAAFGINLDTGNFRSPDPYADMALVAPHALNVQVKVALRVNGKSQPADYARIIRILRDAGYDNYVVLEYEAKEDPLTAIPRHIEALRKAIAEACKG
ncbi:MAG: sugar phosphate isomerase/epimerase [Candidatus Brocadiae bacterium]|nr:sugar phosphate isomerase/epimerase [Candidatus Brocadiia bacterium]